MNDALKQEFEALVGKDNVMVSESDRFSYAYDAAVLEPVMPSLVCLLYTSDAADE